MKIAVASSGLGHVNRGVETWALTLAKGLALEGEDVTLFSNEKLEREGEAPLVPMADDGRRMRGSGKLGVGISQNDFGQNDGIGEGERGRGRTGNERDLRVVILDGLKRSDVWVKRLARWMPGFTWRFGWKSEYGWEQFLFWLKLWPYLKRESFDILHIQDPVVAWWCEMFGWMRLVKTKVILVNGTEEDMRFLSERRHVQELSPQYITRHLNLPIGYTRHCIPNFVDICRFKPMDRQECRKKLGLPDDAFIVLSVGAIGSTNKRMAYLIDEFQTAALGNAVLLLVGADDEQGKCVAQYGKEKLGDSLVVMSDVSHEDMPVVYGAADLFVLCALKEIFGIAFLEAMACGLSCVGHKYPVTEWIVGNAGLCVDMQKKGALSGAVDEATVRGGLPKGLLSMVQAKRDAVLVRNNGEIRNRRGGKARRWVKEMFSWDAVYPQFMEMYKEVVGVEGDEEREGSFAH